MSDVMGVSADDVLAALQGPPPPPLPGALGVGQAVIAAAGAWGRLGAVVVLRREDDGALVDDTHLLAADDTGRWQEPTSSAGSGMPEWVLERPAGAFQPWLGQHLWVVVGQLAVVPGHGWCGDVTVMVSRAVAEVQFVHGQETHRVTVPDSGLVTVARPVRSWREEVRVGAVDERSEVLGEQGYPFLTDAERGWPDPALWVGHWSQP